MPNATLDVFNGLAGIELVPAPVQVLGHQTELDDEVPGEVLGLGLAALLPPQAQEGVLVGPHDDPSIRATDEGAAVDTLDGIQRSLRHCVYSSIKIQCRIDTKSIA